LWDIPWLQVIGASDVDRESIAGCGLWKIVLTPAPVGDVGNGCVSVAHEKTREAASWQDDFEEFVLRGVHWCVLSVLVFSGSRGSSMAVAANWDAGGGGCNPLRITKH
jgi:hypothetical protein